jgi:hypothetical protein
MCLMCVILLDLRVYPHFMYEILVPTHVWHLVLALREILWCVSTCMWLPVRSSRSLFAQHAVHYGQISKVGILLICDRHSGCHPFFIHFMCQLEVVTFCAVCVFSSGSFLEVILK